MLSRFFRLLFTYPAVAYSHGRLSLLSGWPRWVLLLAILAGAGLLAWQIWRPGAGAVAGSRARLRAAVIWALQGLMLALLLALLWRPALVVATVVPRQNIVAVLLDDSASMGLETPSRLDQVKKVFTPAGLLLTRLAERFQVRLYRFSEGAQRISSSESLGAAGRTTRLQETLQDVLSDVQGLPLGAVVLVSDGADNASRLTGGALAELKSRHVPLHTIGVGTEHFERDLQVNDVTVPSRIQSGGIATASVSVQQEGYAGKTVNLEVRENGTLIHAVPVRFDRPAQSLTLRVTFTPRSQGVKEFTFTFPTQSDETIRQNNQQSRVILVDDRKTRILYVEGEPRWEYKFIRRAVEDDPTFGITTLLRTSGNKFYRQGIESEKVLEGGFPKQEELFGYEGLLLGSLEAGFFSSPETQDIYDFVNRRGGGLLLLGGRAALGDGGYQHTALADLFPVVLPNSAAPTFLRNEARAELTAYGLDHPMLQLAAAPEKSKARWKALPLLGDYQRTGQPKPGAVVLATATAVAARETVPLLVSQRFGRGLTFMFATGSSWRWRMEMEHTDDSHQLFWRQLLRGLVSETAGPVRVLTDRALYSDERRVEVRAEVRDKQFRPIENAEVHAVVTAPDGARHELPLIWSPQQEGFYGSQWEASGTGTFGVEVTAHRRPGTDGKAEEIGRGTTYFQRTEGTLEYYNAQQNRPLLARLAEETGGRYYRMDQTSELPEEIVYSEGGVTEHNAHELWHLPIVLLVLLGLKGAEWSLRKRWGSV